MAEDAHARVVGEHTLERAGRLGRAVRDGDLAGVQAVAHADSPPWWNETQVAPDAMLTMQFRSGQSATASVPSFMPSVSRLGDATDPQSR